MQEHRLLRFHEESKESPQGKKPQVLVASMRMACSLKHTNLAWLYVLELFQTSSRQDDRPDAFFTSYKDPLEDCIGPEG